MAEDCLLTQPIERLLSRKPTLKFNKSAAISDPLQTLAPASNHSRSGHFVRLHAFFMCLHWIIISQAPILEDWAQGRVFLIVLVADDVAQTEKADFGVCFGFHMVLL
jgi:hypothetical protein